MATGAASILARITSDRPLLLDHRLSRRDRRSRREICEHCTRRGRASARGASRRGEVIEDGPQRSAGSRVHAESDQPHVLPRAAGGRPQVGDDRVKGLPPEARRLLRRAAVRSGGRDRPMSHAPRRASRGVPPVRARWKDGRSGSSPSAVSGRSCRITDKMPI